MIDKEHFGVLFSCNDVLSLVLQVRTIFALSMRTSRRWEMAEIKLTKKLGKRISGCRLHDIEKS